jgi:hypothetical protein
MNFDLCDPLQHGGITIPKAVVSEECHVIRHAALLARWHIGTAGRLECRWVGTHDAQSMPLKSGHARTINRLCKRDQIH